MNDAWKPFTPPGPFPKWPSWRYGPSGEAAIFDKEEDVPAGWADHPSNAQVIAAAQDITAAPYDVTPVLTPTPTPTPTRKPLTLKRREQTAE